MKTMARKRITISVDDKVIKWLDEMVDEGQFFNRSHGFEFLVKNAIRGKVDKSRKIKEIKLTENSHLK